MYPTFIIIGGFVFSSFAIFITLAFLFGVFTVWRLSRAWDLDEEKALDLTILTFLGGLIGARVYFVLEHLNLFSNSILKMILPFKQSGFSFWGGFLGGWLMLYLCSKKFKLDFWHVADLGSVAFLGSLIFADTGCFLANCDPGVFSKLLHMNIPVSLIEALAIFIVFRRVWTFATHFHIRGTVVSTVLMILGAIELLMEPFRRNHSGNYIFATTILILGLVIFYRITKRSFILDLKSTFSFFLKLFTSKESRNRALQDLGKWWYNQKTLLGWRIHNFKKTLRKIYARST